MREERFYQLLERDSLATPAVADYMLCGKLIDRDLKGFVRLLPRYYDADSTLPRHYREALVLYSHLNAATLGSVTHYVDEAINQEYEQLQELMAQYPEGSEKQLKMLEVYRNTYWYYYSN